MLVSEVISVVIVECIRLSAHIFFSKLIQFELAASEVFFVPRCGSVAAQLLSLA